MSGHTKVSAWPGVRSRRATGRLPAMTSNQQTLADLFRSGGIRIHDGDLLRSQPATGQRAWDRVEGMLLGLAIGDSLGNTSEGKNPDWRGSYHGEIRDYLPNRHADFRPVGVPSDDSQMAFWTLEQLLEDGAYDPARLAERFCDREIFGIGSAVREFTRRHRDERLPWHTAGTESAGNGSLMRIAPMLVPHLRQPTPALWADTALSAMTTHNDTASVGSSVAFIAMLWELLAMPDVPKADWWADRFLTDFRDLELPSSNYTARGGKFKDQNGRFSDLVERWLADAHARGLDTLTACNEWHSGAYLLETVPCVLYILSRHAHDPEEAMVRAVNDTRDNDTVAAIVGAAVGALHGASKLPGRWRADLLGRTAASDDGRVHGLIEQARRQFAVETAGAAPAPPPVGRHE